MFRDPELPEGQEQSPAGRLLSGCSVEEQALVMEIHGSKMGIAASKAQRPESTQDLFLVLHLQSKKLLQEKKKITLTKKKLGHLGFLNMLPN